MRGHGRSDGRPSHLRHSAQREGAYRLLEAYHACSVPVKTKSTWQVLNTREGSRRQEVLNQKRQQSLAIHGTRWHSMALDGTRWHSLALNGTQAEHLHTSGTSSGYSHSPFAFHLPPSVTGPAA